MEIYIGGSYQGKLKAAQLRNQEIFYCQDEELVYAPVISGLHCWIASCFKKQIPIDFDFYQARDCLILMDECNQGLVPIDENERALRECLGKWSQTLCSKAERVTLFIAGIPLVIKED